jgi:hypothetical protein
MPITKKELIDALLKFDVPDDTIVVKTSGIGFEDINDVKTQNIVNWFNDKDKEIPAIVLD